jgi:hypothetical protein
MHATTMTQNRRRMTAGRRIGRRLHTVCVALLIAATVCSQGCSIYGRPQRTTTRQATLDANCPPEPGRMPAKELAKVSLPPYVIEPPDILLIDALRVVPKPPFRIQSFDFDLNPKECFNDTVQHQISAYHQIDISKDRVYYKVEIEPLKNQFSYLIYVFNLDLSRAHVFCLESLNNSDVLIKNEMAYYNKENGDGSFSFFVRSLKTRELVHNFRLEFDSLFDYDVGPNGNLFVFVNNTSTINEYNTDGFMVQAVRLSIEPSVDRYCQLRINDTFDFTIHDKDRRVVYFNSQ